MCTRLKGGLTPDIDSRRLDFPKILGHCREPHIKRRAEQFTSTLIAYYHNTRYIDICLSTTAV